MTQKLVNQNKITALIGALNSSCTIADMEITAASKIPQITPCSSAQSIVEQGNEFIFRTTATDTTHIKTLFKYFKEKITDRKWLCYMSPLISAQAPLGLSRSWRRSMESMWRPMNV